jgi:hypothetical protein
MAVKLDTLALAKIHYKDIIFPCRRATAFPREAIVLFIRGHYLNLHNPTISKCRPEKHRNHRFTSRLGIPLVQCAYTGESPDSKLAEAFERQDIPR